MTSASLSSAHSGRSGGSSSSRLIEAEYQRFLEAAEVDQFLSARSQAQIFDSGDLAEPPVSNSGPSELDEFLLSPLNDLDLSLLDAYSVADVDYVRHTLRPELSRRAPEPMASDSADFDALLTAFGIDADAIIPTSAAGETARLRSLTEQAFRELASDSDALDLPLSGS